MKKFILFFITFDCSVEQVNLIKKKFFKPVVLKESKITNQVNTKRENERIITNKR